MALAIPAAALAASTNASSPVIVVALGLGVVFFGLFLIIIAALCMSAVVRAIEKSKKSVTKANSGMEAVAMEEQPSQGDDIQNREQLVAAISCAVATVMGSDVSGIRILSLKKVK